MTHNRLAYAVGTHPGLRRELNEDSAYVQAPVFGVADGMGGHAFGEIASATAVEVLAQLDLDRDPLESFGAMMDAIALQLTDLAEQDLRLRGMGTTLTALRWLDEENRFAVAHIGDSRCYLMRDGELQQVTHDHTMVQALVDDGRMPAEQAALHPRRSMLMRALQAGSSPEPDLFLLETEPHDRYLLCSDGLTDVVPPEAIGEVLANTEDREEAITQLIDLANDAGGPDNITCVLVDIVDDDWLAAWSGHLL
jgi:protein phosphatase